MRELLPGVLTWPWFSERNGYDFNGYLFRDAAGNLAVDPVQMPDEVLAQLAREGVRDIVLTNRNHFRDAARLRAATGAQVWVHPADAEFVRGKGVQVDAALAHGARIGPFTVLDAHGKSPGEIALHDAARELLVVGDACISKPAPAGSARLALLPSAVIDDLPALRRSLEWLAREVAFEVLLPGDGVPILSGGRAALRELCATFPEV
jgi:glyoxylase-like metal-dependent hydrolase (beta-lactamase superfamily II)